MPQLRLLRSAEEGAGIVDSGMSHNDRLNTDFLDQKYFRNLGRNLGLAGSPSKVPISD
jgi:hypothetical protein